MNGHTRSGIARSSQKKARIALILALVALALVLVVVCLESAVSIVQNSRARQAIRSGQVSLEGVRVSWDLDRDSLTTTLYLLNNSESKIEGDLVVEFAPDPERLADSYLEELAKKEAPHGEGERLVASLEGRPRLSARERALLNYLKRGMRTDFPSYETIVYESGQRPGQLVFRKKTSRVTLPAHELARVVVTQDIPEARMGESITEKNAHIVDIEF